MTTETAERTPPKFGQRFVNDVASDDNPRKIGMYVQTIRTPHGRMNPGTFYELTDGNGDFWQVSPERLAPADPDPQDVENLRLERMALSGQNLAHRWGHPEWSNSWAEQVAAAMYNAYRSVPSGNEGITRG